MTQIEQVVAKIERLKADYVPKVNEEYRGFAEHLLDLIIDDINSLQAKQPSEDLEDEIKGYFSDWLIDTQVEKYFHNIAHHFANWQKERMLRSALNGIMYCDDSNEWVEITDGFIVTPSIAGKKVKWRRTNNES